MTERLTKEQIDRAKIDRSHVAIRALDSFGENYWQSMREEVAKLESPREKNNVYFKALAPYSQVLEGKDFPLQSCDIVSIWSRALEISPKNLYFRYRLATCLASLYGSNGISSPNWRNIFPQMGEKGEFQFLETLAMQDKPNALRFRERLSQIGDSLEALDEYHLHGKPDVGELIKKAIEGDKHAEAELHRIQAQKDEVFDAIKENWGNGFWWMFASLNGIIDNK